MTSVANLITVDDAFYFKHSVLKKLLINHPTCIVDEEKSTKDQIVLRVQMENEKELENFKNEYSTISNTEWVTYHQTRIPQKFICGKSWICHNTGRHKISTSKRNAMCHAKINIVVKKLSRYTAYRDKFLKQEPPLQGVVRISLKHSHNTASADSLQMLRVNDEVKKTFYKYFDTGMSPAEVVRCNENKFILQGDVQGLVNAAFNPKAHQVYYLHNFWKKNIAEEIIDPFEQLKEDISIYESKGTSVKFIEGESWAVVLVTSIMERIKLLDNSSKVIFVDSTCVQSKAKLNTVTITTLLVVTKVGVLPVAVLVHSSQSVENYITAFQLLKDNFPQCFGKSDEPEIFMMDDCSEKRRALSVVWPESKQLLSQFHVTQAELSWLYIHSSVPKENRHHFMKAFQAVMYSTTENDLEKAVEYVLQNCQNEEFLSRFHRFYERKDEWVSLYRQHLITDDDNIINYTEATIGILKQIIQCRTKAFHIVAICDFFTGLCEDYLIKELLDIAHSKEIYVKNVYSSLCKRSLSVNEDSLIELCDGIYEMKCGEKVYLIQANVSMCSCFAGKSGVFCWHQNLLMELNKIKPPNTHSLSQLDKYTLAWLALGSKCPPFAFFSPISEGNNSVDNQVLDQEITLCGENISNILTKCQPLISFPSLYSEESNSKEMQDLDPEISSGEEDAFCDKLQQISTKPPSATEDQVNKIKTQLNRISSLIDKRLSHRTAARLLFTLGKVKNPKRFRKLVYLRANKNKINVQKTSVSGV